MRAFRDGEFTDLTIICGDSTFEVHQVVVCTTCEFFKQSIRFGKEAEEKRINLPEDDPEMIRRLINYLYIGEYDPSHGTSLHNFNDMMKLHPSASPITPTHHPRYRKEGLFGGVDNCACLTFNKENTPQPISVVVTKDQPSDFALIEKPAFGLEVSNPLTIHATMYVTFNFSVMNPIQLNILLGIRLVISIKLMDYARLLRKSSKQLFTIMPTQQTLSLQSRSRIQQLPIPTTGYETPSWRHS